MVLKVRIFKELREKGKVVEDETKDQENNIFNVINYGMSVWKHWFIFTWQSTEVENSP